MMKKILTGLLLVSGLVLAADLPNMDRGVITIARTEMRKDGSKTEITFKGKLLELEDGVFAQRLKYKKRPKNGTETVENQYFLVKDGKIVKVLEKDDFEAQAKKKEFKIVKTHAI